MNFHTPRVVKKDCSPAFMERGSELVGIDKIFTNEEYPKFKESMVKIAAQDGRMIYLPLSKFKQPA
jgi:hypothetical protein